MVSDPQLLAPPCVPPSPPRNCFRSRVPLSVNGADRGWRRPWKLGQKSPPTPRTLLTFLVRSGAAAARAWSEREEGGSVRRGGSALSRLEWNRPRAKFLMERVCLSSPRPRPSVACDAVVGMRKRPTESKLSLLHDSRHSRAHIKMHQSEWLKLEILLRGTPPESREFLPKDRRRHHTLQSYTHDSDPGTILLFLCPFAFVPLISR